MSIERPPRSNHAPGKGRTTEYSGNVRPLHDGIALPQAEESPHRGDELLALLSPLLEEAARLQGDASPHRENNDFLLLLLENNARLRKLAVQLSNLLGDLPAKDAQGGS